MTDQEKQKLNEKLAEWVGFKEAGFGWFNKLGEPDPNTLIQKVYRGTLNRSLNFTDSLDACVKWLVPKLKMYELNSYNNDGLHSAWVSLSEDGGWEASECETPALALCLAVEKLIDEEG